MSLWYVQRCPHWCVISSYNRKVMALPPSLYDLPPLFLPSPSLLPSAPPLPQTLDYETTTSYSLLMRARDQAPPFNENTANITITILDTNDNAPQFSMPGGAFLPPSSLLVSTVIYGYACSECPPSSPPPHTHTHTHAQVTLCKYRREHQSTSQLAQ